MVGDEFDDVRLRIEESRELVRQVRVAVLKSKQLVINAKEWLAEFLAGADLPEFDGDGQPKD